MNNIYSRLLTDIQDRLAEQIPELQLIDLDLGQDQTETLPALAYPAALVDAGSTEFSGMGGLSQFATSTLSVRILTANYTSSAQFAPDAAREEAMRAFELDDKVVSALHGWTPDGGYCQALIRTADRSENRNDIGLRVRVITFVTAWEAIDDGSDATTVPLRDKELIITNNPKQSL